MTSGCNDIAHPRTFERQFGIQVPPRLKGGATELANGFLKAVKRQMYGRAGLGLLKQRVPAAA